MAGGEANFSPRWKSSTTSTSSCGAKPFRRPPSRPKAPRTFLSQFSSRFLGQALLASSGLSLAEVWRKPERNSSENRPKIEQLIKLITCDDLPATCFRSMGDFSAQFLKFIWANLMDEVSGWKSKTWIAIARDLFGFKCPNVRCHWRTFFYWFVRCAFSHSHCQRFLRIALTKLIDLTRN